MSISKHDLISILAKLGNRSPHSKHIQLLEKLLRGTTIKQELSFENTLTDTEAL